MDPKDTASHDNSPGISRNNRISNRPKSARSTIDAPIDASVYKEEDEKINGTGPSVTNTPLTTTIQSISAYREAAKFIDKDESCSLLNIASIVALAFLEVFFIGLLMMIPSMLAWLCIRVPAYNIFLVKGPSDRINRPMEFFRWSFFTAIAYAVWCGIQAVSKIAPLIIRRSWFLAKQPIPYSVKCQLAYWKTTRGYVGFTVFCLVLLGLLDVIISENTQFRTMLRGTFTRLHGISYFSVIIEKSGLVLWIFAILLACEKFIIQVIAVAFHKNAISDRIRESNLKYDILRRLNLQIATAPQSRSKNPLSILGAESVTSLYSFARDIELIDQKSDESLISTKKKAILLGNVLWSGLCPHNRDYLTSDDFRAFFIKQTADDAFAIFDSNSVGIVDKKEFVNKILEIREERSNLLKSLEINAHIINKLDLILLISIIFFTLITTLGLFNPTGYVAISSIITIVLSFGFLFRDSLQRIFNSFFFILVEHPYDVGDMVIIDNESLKVFEIEIFTTIFIRESDNLVIYIPNNSLASKSIFNPRRSSIKVDTLLLPLSTDTSLIKLAQLQKKLVVWLQETNPTFTGRVEVLPIELDGRRVSVKAECHFHEDPSIFISEKLRIARKEEIATKIQEFLDELGIKVVI